MASKKYFLTPLNLMLFFWLAVAPTLAGGPESQPPPPPAILPFVPGEIIIKFQAHVGMLGAQSSLHTEGFEALETSPVSGLLRVRVTPGREREAIADLLARGDVEYATVNHQVQASDTPNDLSFYKQWGLHNTGQTGGLPDADIDAVEAWDIYPGTGNVTIAIVDTGVDLDHPDLQAKIVPGWDFVNNDSMPDDDHGHGTHVAGIAAAIGNNSTGVAGVSWGAKIMPVKVLSASGSGNIFNVANAIYYAVDHGARVINMSLGAAGTAYPCLGFEAVRDAMQYALNHGSLVMVAAGNESASAVSCPAAYEQAIAVGSTTSSDLRSYFSNYGAQLDIAAPGSSIFSTLKGGSYGTMSGTSMATPHVAGLAALIWSAAPSLTNTQVRYLIQNSADDLGAVGWDQTYGFGRINAAAALGLQAPDVAGLLLPAAEIGAAADTTITLTTLSAADISWTAVISPTVPWLQFTSASSGTASAGSPTVITLQGSSLPAYDPPSTNLIITSATAQGHALPTLTTAITRWEHQYYFPIIMR